MGKRIAVGLIMLAVMVGGGFKFAEASTGEETFRRAEEFIQEAEAAIRPDTSSRIRQKLAEAKGVLTSAKMGSPPTGAPGGTPAGKYSLSHAELQALWAESVAREVIFLTTGKLR